MPTTNFIVTGYGDLDTIFAALTGTKRADVGFVTGATDISNYFHPSQGAYDRIGYNTNFKSGADDLRVLFRDKTYIPSYTLVVNNGTGDGTYGVNVGVTVTADASANAYFSYWSGDTAFLADPNASPTTFTGVTETVTYTITAIYDNLFTYRAASTCCNCAAPARR